MSVNRLSKGYGRRGGRDAPTGTFLKSRSGLPIQTIRKAANRDSIKSKVFEERGRGYRGEGRETFCRKFTPPPPPDSLPISEYRP